MELRKSTSSKSFFKWRSRSTKSTSETDFRDSSVASPLTPMSAPPNFQAFESRPPSSPFVSESAHVFSLQHPTVTLFPNINQGSVDISPSIGSTDSISPMNGTDKARGTSTPPSSSPSSGGLYDKAKRSLESKFKLRVRIEVRRC
jgi:hypothetical protein